MWRQRIPAPDRQRVMRLQRRVLPGGLLWLLMALPGAAHPIGLTELLRLPLEQLLRLEISGPASTLRPRAGASLAPPVPAERSAG